jgi:hypothetical protein
MELLQPRAIEEAHHLIRTAAPAQRPSEGSKVDLGGPQADAVIRACGTLLLLLAATAIAVYKPWGVIRCGWRKHEEQRRRQHINKPGLGQTEEL